MNEWIHVQYVEGVAGSKKKIVLSSIQNRFWGKTVYSIAFLAALPYRTSNVQVLYRTGWSVMAFASQQEMLQVDGAGEKITIR